MSSQARSPDVVVGIDFGMTCTGVAYSCGPEWHIPKTIQNWPGRSLANKVATVVSYRGQQQTPVNWGFLAEPETGQDSIAQRDFKLFLDPDYRRNLHGSPSPGEARRYFRDYLGCLYTFIQQQFERSQPQWATKRVEFLFSVPTTWKNPGMIVEIQQAIKEAGFGKQPGHTARVTLTEAEAAAVYAAKEDYRTDDVFMVCDAGGGTTDVNILKVVASGLGVTKLTPLSHVEGEPIGSTIIDYRVAAHVEQLLKLTGYPFQKDIALIADEIVRDKLDTFKCAFGSDDSNLPFIPLPVPELPQYSTYPNARIENSTIMLPREVLQNVFDEMFDRLSRLIDGQLISLQHRHGRETVSYLVLSGGLGSSPYLGHRLKEHYGNRVNLDHPNAPRLKILYAAEPQLAVCHGLVMDRVQEIRSFRGIFTERCCRVNYGIVVRVPYNEKEHAGAKVKPHELDQKVWAEDQIHWLVKRGQIVSVSAGVQHRYTHRLPLYQAHKPWKAKIVMSPLSGSDLPSSVTTSTGRKHSDVVEVCTLDVQLQQSDMKLKNRHWYNTGSQYWRAEFDLKVLIGPADLKFEIHGKDGKCSKDHESIQVSWYSPTKSSRGAINENGSEVQVEWEDAFFRD